MNLQSALFSSSFSLEGVSDIGMRSEADRWPFDEENNPVACGEISSVSSLYFHLPLI